MWLQLKEAVVVRITQPAALRTRPRSGGRTGRTGGHRAGDQHMEPQAGPEQRVTGGESATLHGRPHTAASATSPTCTGPSAGAAVTEARSTVFGGGGAPGSRPVTSPHSPGTSARGPDPGPRASLCARAILSASGANMASRHRGARTGAPTCR